MRKAITILSIFCTIAISCIDKQKDANLEMKNKVYDFGIVKNPQIVRGKFELKNVGETEIIIKNVHHSCGCTKIDYPKTPIAKNEKGYLAFEYSTLDDSGSVEKAIAIESNSKNVFDFFVIKGYVEKKTNK